ncbi:MAG: hypothetical protein ACNYZG_09110, partial [Gammaproteobacteria bacterium]
MRFVFTILLISLLSVSMVHATANCQHSNSWQCANNAGNSGLQSQTSGAIATSGNTPNTGTTNTPLGTTTLTQPQVQITPLAGHQVVGTGAIPTVKPVVAPPKPQIAVPPKQPVVAPPLNVYPLPQQVFTGQGAVPQPQPVVVPPKQPVV